MVFFNLPLWLHSLRTLWSLENSLGFDHYVYTLSKRKQTEIRYERKERKYVVVVKILKSIIYRKLSYENFSFYK